MDLKLKWMDINGAAGESGNIMLLRCDRSRDTPADSLVCQVALKQPVEELRQVWLTYQGSVLFEGFLDKQEQWHQGGWQMVRLTARSRGGLLLDNEAMPQVYESPTMAQVFARHCQPYGVGNGVLPGFLSRKYVVSKGMSEWEAFSVLCRLITGKTPFLEKDMVVITKQASKLWNLGGKTGLPVTEVKQVFTRHKVVSQVVIRDILGQYTSGVENPAAVSKGIRRKRYLIPSPQWALDGRGNADSILQESAKGWECWQVQAAGIVDAYPGDFARCQDKWGRSFEGVVEAVQLQWGQQGQQTKIVIYQE